MANPTTLAQYIEQKTAFDPRTVAGPTVLAAPPPAVAEAALLANQKAWDKYVADKYVADHEAAIKASIEQIHKLPDVKSTLEARGNRYGDFVDNACVSQDFKTTLRKGPSWNTMAADQKEALEMIVHKIARILNGDPNYSDSWHDIAGYATLVCDRLKKYE